MKKGLIAALVLGMGATAPAFASDQHWACEVVLCMANPKGPLALKECEPSIKKAWKAWAKGKSVPSCKKQDAQGVDTGEITKAEGLIETSQADPVKNCPTQFTYYATRNKTKHCAFSGVTNQYIDGQLWGRIWYGGPNGEPWVEQLVDDPKNPRPPEKLPAIWSPMKSDIQAKADASLMAFNKWKASQKEADQAAATAYQLWQEANNYLSWLGNFEADLPAQILAATDAYSAAEAALDKLYPDLSAAEAAAKLPGATAKEKQVYEELLAQAHALLAKKQGAADALNYYQYQQTQLPLYHGKAQTMVEKANAAQTIADQLKAVAKQDKATADAAEAAAQPLPEPNFS